MRKVVIRKAYITTSVIVLSLSSSSAYALGTIIPPSPANGLYYGVNIGPSVNHDTTDEWQDGSLSNQKSDDSGFAHELYGGYQVNPYVAIQGSYKNLGKATLTAQSDGTGNSWEKGPIRGEHEATGWAISVTGRWPISERWTLVGTLSWFWWESEEKYTEPSLISGSKNSDSSPSFSGGVEFDHGHKDRIVYTAGIGHQQVGNDDYDVTTGFAGVMYRFP